MKKAFWLVPALVLGWSVAASADMAQVKLYKEAFPEAKPKCLACHTEAMPKKDAHELNAYGKAVLKLSAAPTAEDYKKAGLAEDFKAEDAK